MLPEYVAEAEQIARDEAEAEQRYVEQLEEEEGGFSCSICRRPHGPEVRHECE